MATVVRPYDWILDGNAGWGKPEETQALDVAATDALRLAPLPPVEPVAEIAAGTFDGWTAPKGVAVQGDTVFVADPDRRQILHWSPCCAIGPLPTIGGIDRPVYDLEQLVPTEIPGRDVLRPVGLTIDARGDLVVLDAGYRRILFFTWPGLALRRIIGPPAGPRRWKPVDVAAGADGSVWVVDFLRTPFNMTVWGQTASVWRFDAQGRLDRRFPVRLPVGFGPSRIVIGSDGRAYIRLEALRQPRVEIAIVSRNGAMAPLPYHLQARVDAVLLSRGDDPGAVTFERESRARASLLPAALNELIDAWLRENGCDCDWITSRSRAYENLLEHYAAIMDRYLRTILPASPLAVVEDRVVVRPSGRGPCTREPIDSDPRVDGAGRLDVEGLEEGSPAVVFRSTPSGYTRSGVFLFPVFDSRRLDNPWHRLVLEMPAGEPSAGAEAEPVRTSVRIFTRTSNSPFSIETQLSDEPNAIDPDDLTALTLETANRGAWQASPVNAAEWLIQSPPGRFMVVAAVLRGPGDETPAIERIYVYGRRRSSLRYLPAIYQADETSRDLLDRFLSLFDTNFAEIETTIEGFSAYLDPAGSPSEFLPWLAAWFDLTLDPEWSDERRRAVLARVVELYRWRGTVRGLRLLVQLATGLPEPMPRIVEHSRAGGDPGLAAWTGIEDGHDPEDDFTVVVPAYVVGTAAQRASLERVIAAAKPAQTRFALRPVFSGGVRLGPRTGGCSSALGIDTILGDAPTWRLPTAAGTETEGVLGGRTVLPAIKLPRAVYGRIGATRLGTQPVGGRLACPCPD